MTSPLKDNQSSAWSPTGKPHVPTELGQILCSKATQKEKRERIEWALEDNADFLHWALVAMYHQQNPEEKMVLKILERDGRGFTPFDLELFEVASDVHARGSMTPSDMIFCRAVKNGRSKVGKYGLQLIALIRASCCPDLVTPRQARYLPPQRVDLQEVA